MKGLTLLVLCVVLGAVSAPAEAQAPARQEALRRFQMGCQIRSDKFNYVLPEVMRETEWTCG